MSLLGQIYVVSALVGSVFILFNFVLGQFGDDSSGGDGSDSGGQDGSVADDGGTVSAHDFSQADDGSSAGHDFSSADSGSPSAEAR